MVFGILVPVGVDPGPYRIVYEAEDYYFDDVREVAREGGADRHSGTVSDEEGVETRMCTGTF